MSNSEKIFLKEKHSTNFILYVQNNASFKFRFPMLLAPFMEFKLIKTGWKRGILNGFRTNIQYY